MDRKREKYRRPENRETRKKSAADNPEKESKQVREYFEGIERTV